MLIQSRAVAVSAVVAVLLAGLILSGADKALACQLHESVRTTVGESKPMGDGTVRSWVTVDSEGKPQSIGLTFTEVALSGLPATHRAYTLALPTEAAATAFDHIEINWEPQGHIPEGIYDVPHFDLHFYMIGHSERDRITATGDDLERVERTPAAEYIPAGYVATPGGEPRMGAHWIDPAFPEFSGERFTRTFIYGFYDGRMVFMEPMVTREFLLTRPSIAQPINLPAAYPKPGYYPTGYSVHYEAGSGEYTVALTGLTPR